LVTLFAHVRCTPPETVTTFGVGAAAAALVIRPWRKTTPPRSQQRSFLTLVLALIVTAAGCGGSTKSSSSTTTTAATRPATTATIQIVSPTPNQVSPPDVVVKVELTGGTVVQRTTGPLTPTEGHVHLTLDGKLVSMAYETEQVLPKVAPGQHAIEAEFVAVDHAPFSNRPKSAVLFEVK
jgi:hypothetical protein